MKEYTVTAIFKSDVEKVFNIVCDTANFNWRSDISNIVTSKNEMQFTEYTSDGFQTEFTVTKKKPYECYEFLIENKNMKGHWTGIFAKKLTGTKVTFIETINVKNPFMRLFVGFYIKKQQATYISDLRKVLGE